MKNPPKAISGEAARWAYRLLLGRDATAAEVADKARFKELDRLTHHLLWMDPEFRASERGKLIVGGEYVPDLGPRSAPSAWSRLFGRKSGLSREDVHWAYRLFLGREPESEWVIGEKLKALDEVELVSSFYHSEEFRHRSCDWAEDFGGAHDGELPLPPFKLRRTVGPTERAHWDNPEGSLVFGDEVPVESYRSVLDFGCGCGRAARRMLQQRPAPGAYVGLDLNPEAIEWCRENLTAVAPSFRFLHLNVHNAFLNPAGERKDVAFPHAGEFSLVNAHSVFTHIVEESVGHYLSECSRVLADDGVFRATWFLFDKTAFPMMQEGQNSLYINVEDPTNAVIYDYRFIEARYRRQGLVITRIVPPSVRGFHWVLVAERFRDGLVAVRFPQDLADTGLVRPPRG